MRNRIAMRCDRASVAQRTGVLHKGREAQSLVYRSRPAQRSIAQGGTGLIDAVQSRAKKYCREEECF